MQPFVAQFEVLQIVQSVNNDVIQYAITIKALDSGVAGQFTVTTTNADEAGFFVVGTTYSASITPA